MVVRPSTKKDIFKMKNINLYFNISKTSKLFYIKKNIFPIDIEMLFFNKKKSSVKIVEAL